MSLRGELLVLFPFGKGLRESFFPHVETLDEDFRCCCHIPMRVERRGISPIFLSLSGLFPIKSYDMGWSGLIGITESNS